MYLLGRLVLKLDSGFPQLVFLPLLRAATPLTDLRSSRLNTLRLRLRLGPVYFILGLR